MNISRRKFFAFALTAMSLSVVAAVVLLLIADLFVHYRAERSAGLNRWGYRGPVASSKKSGELRAVMLGGSTVFGYGVQWDQSIPAQLERTLNASRPFSVVNLGFNNEGAYSFVPTLRDFEYLDYDIVVLYEGYNDLPGDEGPNTSRVPAQLGDVQVDRLLPDPADVSRREGDDAPVRRRSRRRICGGPRRAPKTVFSPNIAARTSAAALDTVATVTNSLGAQLGRLSKVEAPAYARISRIGCSFPWVNYCDSVHAAVREMLAKGKRVVVVGQPRMTEGSGVAHARQQKMLGAMIRSEFASEPHVVYVDLGDAVNLTDATYTFDSMHLNADGNRVLAEALAPHVLAMAAK